jgi:hypothetical protein
MSQRVKIQISSDLDDVTRLSSVLLEEALLHTNDLVSMVNNVKGVLRDLDLSKEEDFKKLETCLFLLNSTRIPLSKTDNRIADVVAIVDGFNKALTQGPESPTEQKEESKNDSVAAG